MIVSFDFFVGICQMLSTLQVAHHMRQFNSTNPSGLSVKVWLLWILSKDCEGLIFHCAISQSIRTWVATYMFCMKAFASSQTQHWANSKAMHGEKKNNRATVGKNVENTNSILLESFQWDFYVLVEFFFRLHYNLCTSTTPGITGRYMGDTL